jgi:hypothetical protein
MYAPNEHTEKAQREQLALNTAIAAAVTELGPKLAPSSQSTSPELRFLKVKWAERKTFQAPMAETWEVFMSIDPLILAECWADTPDLTSLGELMRTHFGGWLDRGHAITLFVEGNTPHSHTPVPTHTLYTPSTNTWYAGVKASLDPLCDVAEVSPAVKAARISAALRYEVQNYRDSDDQLSVFDTGMVFGLDQLVRPIPTPSYHTPVIHPYTDPCTTAHR